MNEMKIPSTKEIAENLLAFCKKGAWQEAYETLYSENASSIEPYQSPIAEVETKGLQAIKDKAKRFDSLIQEVHKIQLSEPIIIQDYIAFSMTMDATIKGKGRGIILSEICLYKIKDGKIVSEEFYYK